MKNVEYRETYYTHAPFLQNGSLFTQTVTCNYNKYHILGLYFKYFPIAALLTKNIFQDKFLFSLKCTSYELIYKTLKLTKDFY